MLEKGKEFREECKAWNAVSDRVLDWQTVLKGRVLTLIDASIADNRQAKGAKDLVHSIFRSSWYDLSEMMIQNAPGLNALVSERERAEVKI